MSDYTREAFERDRFATAGPVHGRRDTMREDFMWMREHDSDEGDEVVTQTVVRDGKLVTEAIQPPATPQEPDTYGPFFDPCDKCVTRTHCAHHDRCLAECVPADLRTSAPPAVWQPIEMAPKGADLILLFSERDGVRAGYWDTVTEKNQPHWFAPESQLVSGGITWPTHWMPLPSPPTPEGTEP